MMRFTAWSAALLGLGFAASLTAEGPTAPALPEYSVLTPAVETHIGVAVGLMPTDFLPVIDAFGDLATRGKTAKLRKVAAADRFDPALMLSDRLVEALAEAGHQSAYEPIARKPAGSIQSLSWSDLPESPKGKLILDVTIRWHCLCRGMAYLDYSPAVALGWRVLDPRGELVEPTRVLMYVHQPGWSLEANPSSTRQSEPTAPAPKYPPAAVSETCIIRDFDDATTNSSVIWGCFGEALDVAARRLVMDLDRARSARLPVTASGDSPSGRSTQ